MPAYKFDAGVNLWQKLHHIHYSLTEPAYCLLESTELTRSEFAVWRMLYLELITQEQADE